MGKVSSWKARILLALLLSTCTTSYATDGLYTANDSDSRYWLSCPHNIAVSLESCVAAGNTSELLNGQSLKQRVIRGWYQCWKNIEQSADEPEPVLRVLLPDIYRDWLEPTLRSFSQLHGVPLQLHTQPMGRLLDTAIADAFLPPGRQHAVWLQSTLTTQHLADVGLSLDLSHMVDAPSSSTEVRWSDIYQLFRLQLASYRGQIVSMPLDGSTMYLIHRADVMTRLGLEVPRTWQGVLDFAAAYTRARAAVVAAAGEAAAGEGGEAVAGETEQGADVIGGDVGELPRYPLCIPRGASCRRLTLLQAIWATIAQTHGSQQGVHFDPATLQPLLDTPAAAEAFRVMAGLLAAAAPEEADEGCTHGSVGFARGRCALVLAVYVPQMRMFIRPEFRPTVNMSQLGVAPVPGSHLVWVRPASKQAVTTSSSGSSSGNGSGSGGELALCDAERCPMATPYVVPSYDSSSGRTAAAAQEAAGEVATRPVLVNHAPLSPGSNLAGAVNRGMPLVTQYIAFELLAFLASLARYGPGEPEPLLQTVAPVREHLVASDAAAVWAAAGYNKGVMAAALAPAGPIAFTRWHPNRAWDLRMPYHMYYNDILAEILKGLQDGTVVLDDQSLAEQGQQAAANGNGDGTASAAALITAQGGGGASDASPAPAGQRRRLLQGTAAAAGDATTTTRRLSEALREGQELLAAYYRPEVYLEKYLASLAITSPDAATDDPAGGVAAATARRGGGVSAATLVPALVVSILALAALGGGGGWVLWRRRRRRRSRGGSRDWVCRHKAGGGAREPVALVVTDIQDSTVLWEALPAAVMSEAVRLHHTVIRKLLRSHGGYESATEGDSFIICFLTVRQAVAFALDLQAQLLLQPWPDMLLELPACAVVSVDLPEGFPFNAGRTGLAERAERSLRYGAGASSAGRNRSRHGPSFDELPSGAACSRPPSGHHASSIAAFASASASGAGGVVAPPSPGGMPRWLRALTASARSVGGGGRPSGLGSDDSPASSPPLAGFDNLASGGGGVAPPHRMSAAAAVLAGAAVAARPASTAGAARAGSFSSLMAAGSQRSRRPPRPVSLRSILAGRQSLGALTADGSASEPGGGGGDGKVVPSLGASETSVMDYVSSGGNEVTAAAVAAAARQSRTTSVSVVLLAPGGGGGAAAAGGGRDTAASAPVVMDGDELFAAAEEAVMPFARVPPTPTAANAERISYGSDDGDEGTDSVDASPPRALAPAQLTPTRLWGALPANTPAGCVGRGASGSRDGPVMAATFVSTGKPPPPPMQPPGGRAASATSNLMPQRPPAVAVALPTPRMRVSALTQSATEPTRGLATEATHGSVATSVTGPTRGSSFLFRARDPGLEASLGLQRPTPSYKVPLPLALLTPPPPSSRPSATVGGGGGRAGGEPGPIASAVMLLRGRRSLPPPPPQQQQQSENTRRISTPPPPLLQTTALPASAGAAAGLAARWRLLESLPRPAAALLTSLDTAETETDVDADADTYGDAYNRATAGRGGGDASLGGGGGSRRRQTVGFANPADKEAEFDEHRISGSVGGGAAAAASAVSVSAAGLALSRSRGGGISPAEPSQTLGQLLSRAASAVVAATAGPPPPLSSRRLLRNCPSAPSAVLAAAGGPPSAAGSGLYKAAAAGLIFRGLRVRVGIHWALPSVAELSYNAAAARMVYGGPCVAAAKGLADMGHGGQVVMSGPAKEQLEVECGAGGSGRPSGTMMLHLGTYALPRPASTAQRSSAIPSAPLPDRPKSAAATATTTITASGLSASDYPPCSGAAATAAAATASTAAAATCGTGGSPPSPTLMVVGNSGPLLPCNSPDPSSALSLWKGGGAAAAASNKQQQPAFESRCVYWVTSPGLSPRLALLPPPRLPPDATPLCDVYGAPTGRVSYVVVQIPAVGALLAWNRGVTEEALRVLQEAAAAQMQRVSEYGTGYKAPCAGDLERGQLCAAFTTASAAVRWAEGLRRELLLAPWPQELLAHEFCEVVEACGAVIDPGVFAAAPRSKRARRRSLNPCLMPEVSAVSVNATEDSLAPTASAPPPPPLPAPAAAVVAGIHHAYSLDCSNHGANTANANADAGGGLNSNDGSCSGRRPFSGQMRAVSGGLAALLMLRKQEGRSRRGISQKGNVIVAPTPAISAAAAAAGEPSLEQLVGGTGDFVEEGMALTMTAPAAVVTVAACALNGGGSVDGPGRTRHNLTSTISAWPAFRQLSGATLQTTASLPPTLESAASSSSVAEAAGCTEVAAPSLAVAAAAAAAAATAAARSLDILVPPDEGPSSPRSGSACAAACSGKNRRYVQVGRAGVAEASPFATPVAAAALAQTALQPPLLSPLELDLLTGSPRRPPELEGAAALRLGSDVVAAGGRAVSPLLVIEQSSARCGRPPWGPASASSSGAPRLPRASLTSAGAGAGAGASGGVARGIGSGRVGGGSSSAAQVELLLGSAAAAAAAYPSAGQAGAAGDCRIRRPAVGATVGGGGGSEFSCGGSSLSAHGGRVITLLRGLRMRAGVATGVAEWSVADHTHMLSYGGRPVAAAAKLAGVAASGQVLCDEATRNEATAEQLWALSLEEEVGEGEEEEQAEEAGKAQAAGAPPRPRPRRQQMLAFRRADSSSGPAARRKSLARAYVCGIFERGDGCDGRVVAAETTDDGVMSPKQPPPPPSVPPTEARARAVQQRQQARARRASTVDGSVVEVTAAVTAGGDGDLGCTPVAVSGGVFGTANGTAPRVSFRLAATGDAAQGRGSLGAALGEPEPAEPGPGAGGRNNACRFSLDLGRRPGAASAQPEPGSIFNDSSIYGTSPSVG